MTPIIPHMHLKRKVIHNILLRVIIVFDKKIITQNFQNSNKSKTVVTRNVRVTKIIITMVKLSNSIIHFHNE